MNLTRSFLIRGRYNFARKDRRIKSSDKENENIFWYVIDESLYQTF